MNRIVKNRPVTLARNFSQLTRLSWILIGIIIINLGFSAVSFAGPKPDTKPPKIKLLLPEDGATATGPMRISVSVKDNQGIMKVAFFIDGELVEEVYNPPYETILNLGFWADGMIHRISAVATDNSENSASTEAVQVTVLESAFTSPTG